MKSRLPLLFLLVCAAGFGFGLLELFKLRFETGDVYPEYSSLRADPLGTMAFCESLERMPGITVRRDYSVNNQLPDGRNTTYLHLAARSEEWEALPEELVKEIEGFLAKGGRLAITFFPEQSPRSAGFSRPSRLSRTNAPATKKPATGPKASPLKKKKPSQDEEGNVLVSAEEKWGFELTFAGLEQNEEGAYEPAEVVKQTDLPLPQRLDWHSALVLTNLDKAWQVLYARGRHPVLAERKAGAGTIVLATDSYFLSNEALRKDRHADLLAWLVGSSRRVVFDEAHLGLTEAAGVGTLMRKYRLHWVLGGLLLLAGLFVWKNSLSLAPPFPEEAKGDYVVGKDAAAGFVNLLRRNVPAREVLNVCFAEWTKSLLHGNPHMIARVDQAQSVIEKENAQPAVIRNPVRAYQKICEILKAPVAIPPDEPAGPRLKEPARGE